MGSGHEPRKARHIRNQPGRLEEILFELNKCVLGWIYKWIQMRSPSVGKVKNSIDLVVY